MNLSLDGFMSGAHGELDWHFETWNDEMGEQLLGQLEKADTLLLGRFTYEAMAKYWTVKPLTQNFPRQDLAIADKMSRHIKLVFSKTRTDSIWNNSRFAVRNPAEEIKRLKRLNGKDIILFGSSSLVSALIHSNQVDEYQLWIHPVILGSGTPLFRNLKYPLNLYLSGSVIFESGVMMLNYRPVKEIKKVASFRRQRVAKG